MVKIKTNIVRVALKNDSVLATNHMQRRVSEGEDLKAAGERIEKVSGKKRKRKN